ncbi:MAG: signal peptidase I [Bacilli bacterium]|nr:signal peptidase I [Bacilli bacterium]
MKRINLREKIKKFKKYLNKAAKLLSYAIIVVLVFLGLFFAYYFVSLKAYEKNPTANIPRFGLYTIISPSMEPNVKVYDVVVDLNVFNEDHIKVGDIITFISQSNISKGLTVTHRVVQIIENEDGTKSFITKGDNNTKTDQAPVNINDIIGKVLFKIPQLGRVQFLLAEKFGWIIIILLPALGVIVYDFIKLFKLLAFNNKFMRFSSINNKIETEINVDDLTQLRVGLDIAKKYNKKK